MKKQIWKKHLINACIITFMLAVVVAIPWFFSAESSTTSNQYSMRMAMNLRIALDKYGVIAKNASWIIALNDIVRKMAHFLEYGLIGLVMCSTLNLMTRRVWLAAFLSMSASPLLACLDEYHQHFVAGRTPRWFDVGVDCTGAITVIILVSIFFYILKLRRKITELEQQKIR